MSKKTHQMELLPFDKIEAEHLPMSICRGGEQSSFQFTSEDLRIGTNYFGESCYKAEVIDLETKQHRTIVLSVTQAKSLKMAMIEHNIHDLKGLLIDVNRFPEGTRFLYEWILRSDSKTKVIKS